jgi:hypothetical protein
MMANHFGPFLSQVAYHVDPSVTGVVIGDTFAIDRVRVRLDAAVT